MPKRSVSPVPVAELLEASVAVFAHHESIQFVYTAPEDDLVVLADREEISRAFVNMLRNAVQAIQGSGQIDIWTVRSDTEIAVNIKDTGCGIPSNLLPRIFEPNFSTKTEGMGLGLSIVQKIISDTDGHIHIESVVGKGTTVTVSLPLYSAA